VEYQEGGEEMKSGCEDLHCGFSGITSEGNPVCFDKNEYVNKDGDPVCGMREDALYVCPIHGVQDSEDCARC
jgi:hypothetical protein